MRVQRGDPRIAVLTNGWHVLYDPVQDNTGQMYWRNPLIVELRTIKEDGKIKQKIAFQPLCKFADTNKDIVAPDRDKILYYYEPSYVLIDRREMFQYHYAEEHVKITSQNFIQGSDTIN